MKTRGSTFVVECSIEQVPENEMVMDSQPPDGAQAQGRNVLVVDDNVDAAETLAMLLELDGHQVRMVHRGNAALEAVARSVPDVVFLDIGLPDLSGYDVAAKMRQMPGVAQVLLVALTGWGADGDREKARLAGIDVHLTKPVTHEDLVAALNRKKTDPA